MQVVPWALLQSELADCHDEMNKVNFNKWIKEKLIPNLPPQ